MHAKDAIRFNFQMSDMVVHKYVEDLDDAAFLVAPVAGMNPIAWQLGHIIVSERSMIEGVKPGSSPALPEGFEAAHPREIDPSTTPKYLKAAEYLALYKERREASLAALDAITDAELDAPAPEKSRAFMPTVGHVFALAATHPLMHAGQFVAVRRQLKKPIAM